MRILILDTMPIRRGAQIFVHDLGNALIEGGHEVKKVYLYAPTEKVVLVLNDNDVVLGGNPHHVFETFPGVHPGLVRKVFDQIKKYQPDVVLFNGSRTYKYAAAVKPFLSRKPVFVFRLIDSVRAWNTSWLKRAGYRHFIYPAMDALVAVGQASLNDFQNMFPTTKPVQVIHRAIDSVKAELHSREAARIQFKLSERDKVVLFLGSLSKQKQPLKFIELMLQIHANNPDVRGWMVGDGPLRKQTENKVSTHGLENVITLWGYQENTWPYIAAADVLVLTSTTEGIPGVVLEAALMNVPVVSYAVGGLEECVEDGRTGFLVNDDQALAGQVMKLLQDEDLRKQVGERAKEKVMNEFLLSAATRQYVEFFQNLPVGQV